MTGLLANRVEAYASPEEGLAAELALLDAVATGCLLRGTLVWETTRSLVVPYQATKRAGFAGAALASALRGRPIASRRTGGAATPQGPGILNLAVAYCIAPGSTARAVYEDLCRSITDAMITAGLHPTVGVCPGSFCDGDYNVKIGGRKVVGTAQRWRRRHTGPGHAVLAHALVLVDCDRAETVEAVSAFESDLFGQSDINRDAHVTLAETGARKATVTQSLITELRRIGVSEGRKVPLSTEAGGDPSCVGGREEMRKEPTT